MADETTLKRAIFWAAVALLAFSGITALSLVAWFATKSDPWSWRTVVALLSVAFGLTAGALVWRAPSRVHVFAGMGVLAFSLLRIGRPSVWTTSTYALLLVTVLLFVPLVRAALLLPRS